MNPAWAGLVDLAAELDSAGDPAQRQWRWLHACLQRNAASRYGRRYGFASIDSPDAYRSRVPLVQYEDLAPHIEACAAGQPDVLFAGLPVAFERTGGSSGGSKLIPYTAASLEDFRRAVLPWLAEVVRVHGLNLYSSVGLDHAGVSPSSLTPLPEGEGNCSLLPQGEGLGMRVKRMDTCIASDSDCPTEVFRLNDGCAYWAISPATRPLERTAGGIPVGLPDAAYLGEAAMSSFVALSAVPPWVGGLDAVADWQLASLYWLLRRADLALISVWSPTFFLGLMDGLDRRQAELAGLLARGGEVAGRGLAADPGAAERLRAYAAQRDSRCLWPGLKLVSAWGDAAARPYSEALQRRLPQAAFQAKGLLSTEGVVTVPGPDGAPVLAADSGFFEFLDGQGVSYLAHELETGERYEVVLSTAGGLYRYRTGDSVICAGYGGGLPQLRFLGRLGLVSDLAGEKLTDAFVSRCLEGIPGFRLLLPRAGAKPGYVLVVDAALGLPADDLAGKLEAGLAANPQYAYARRLGQLGPVVVLPAAAPLDKFLERAVQQGARLGDVKLPGLRPEPDWLPLFEEGRPA